MGTEVGPDEVMIATRLIRGITPDGVIHTITPDRMANAACEGTVALSDRGARLAAATLRRFDDQRCEPLHPPATELLRQTRAKHSTSDRFREGWVGFVRMVVG
jgi:hypothetical protein